MRYEEGKFRYEEGKFTQHGEEPLEHIMRLSHYERDFILRMRMQPKAPKITELSYGKLIDDKYLLVNKGIEDFKDKPSNKYLQSLIDYECEEGEPNIVVWGTKNLSVNNIKHLIAQVRPYWRDGKRYWYMSSDTHKKIEFLFASMMRFVENIDNDKPPTLYGIEIVINDIMGDKLYLLPLEAIKKYNDSTIIIKPNAIGILNIKN